MIPQRTVWQPTPVFLPGEYHGQRSLVGYNPQVCKELDVTEATEHAMISDANYLAKDAKHLFMYMLPSVCFLWRNVYLGLLHSFRLGCWFFDIELFEYFGN